MSILAFGVGVLAGTVVTNIVWMGSCSKSYRRGYDAGYENGRIVGRLGDYEKGYEAYRNVKEADGHVEQVQSRADGSE